MMGSKLRGPADEPANGKRTLSKLPTGGLNLEEAVDFDSVFRTSYEQGDGLIIMAVKDIFRQISLVGAR
jgi:hypothetical protein